MGALGLGLVVTGLLLGQVRPIAGPCVCLVCNVGACLVHVVE